MNSKRVILDTNLWISFLISKDFSFIDEYIEKGIVKLVFSAELFSEFITVAERPKLKKYFSKKDLKALTRIIDKFGILVEITSEIDLCRDTNDNFLLNLAIDSKADFLVTGDKDLLEIGNIHDTQIIKMDELRTILQ